MERSITLILLFQFTLILLNAIFACIEIAVISTNARSLDRLARRGDRRAKRLLKLSKQPSQFLATIQVAITLSGFLGSAFAAENFSDDLVHGLQALGATWSPQTLDAIAVVAITFMLSYVTLVLGELVPKRLALQHAESLALKLSGIVWTVYKLFAPLVWILTASTNRVLRMLGVDPQAEPESVSEEEIRMMVDAGSEGGTIDTEEKEFIQNVFEFDDLTAGEIATHRTEVEALYLQDSDEAWEEKINASRYSRYPICDDTIDKVVGILIVKDWFRLKDRSRAAVMAEAVRPPVFISEHLKADVLFRNMKRNFTPFTVVCDEYGGVQGILTISDLVEQLLGKIGDEDEVGTQEEPPEIEKIAENTWRVLGSAPLDEVSKTLEVTLEAEGCDTFGGYVLGQLGEIPQEGEAVLLKLENMTVEVKKIHNRRVEETIVLLPEKPLPEEADDEEDDHAPDHIND